MIFDRSLIIDSRFFITFYQKKQIGQTGISALVNLREKYLRSFLGKGQVYKSRQLKEF